MNSLGNNEVSSEAGLRRLNLASNKTGYQLFLAWGWGLWILVARVARYVATSKGGDG